MSILHCYRSTNFWESIAKFVNKLKCYCAIIRNCRFRFHFNPCFLKTNMLVAERLKKLAFDEQIKILSTLSDDPQNKLLEEKLSEVSKIMWNTNNLTLCPLNPSNLGRNFKNNASFNWWFIIPFIIFLTKALGIEVLLRHRAHVIVWRSCEVPTLRAPFTIT